MNTCISRLNKCVSTQRSAGGRCLGRDGASQLSGEDELAAAEDAMVGIRRVANAWRLLVVGVGQQRLLGACGPADFELVPLALVGGTQVHKPPAGGVRATEDLGDAEHLGTEEVEAASVEEAFPSTRHRTAVGPPVGRALLARSRPGVGGLVFARP